eukprot:7371895-Ditylum_brightwellii.AAC.1
MTSTTNNIFEGQEACFEVNSAFGDIFKKSSSLYQVNWNYIGLKPWNIASSYLLPAVLLAAD